MASEFTYRESGECNIHFQYRSDECPAWIAIRLSKHVWGHSNGTIWRVQPPQTKAYRYWNCEWVTAVVLLSVYTLGQKDGFVDSVKFMVTDCLQADRETTEVGDNIHIRLTYFVPRYIIITIICIWKPNEEYKNPIVTCSTGLVIPWNEIEISLAAEIFQLKLMIMMKNEK